MTQAEYEDMLVKDAVREERGRILKRLAELRDNGDCECMRCVRAVVEDDE